MTGWNTIGVGLRSYQERFEESRQVCGGIQGGTGGVTGPVGSLKRFGSHQGGVWGSSRRGMGISGRESVN